MDRGIITTSDGSHSIAIPEMGVTYHSSHGAIQESMHVFIKAGLIHFNEQQLQPAVISIFEMGFGTGLNVLLTIAEAEKTCQHIYYETIELYPLSPVQYEKLNYCAQLNRPDLVPLFNLLHTAEWNMATPITPFFTFKKIQASLADFSPDTLFHIVYFDAFAPEKQPTLWTAAVFYKLFTAMHSHAVLTTYCSKSIVRKAMTEAGWKVEKIAGPPHKREMVRALKQP